MSYELKIKSKSLAAEARIIRAEEVKLKGLIRSRTLHQRPSTGLRINRENLYRHRTDIVRTEARATFLARAFLKGLPRSAVEANHAPSHITHRSFKIANKYASEPLEREVYDAWMEEAA